MDEVRFRNFLKHSANVSHAVLRSPVLNLQEKGLYSILCSYGWSGSAFPGQKRLAEENGVTDRTIRNHIKRLVELGLLTVEDRRKENKTNLYIIEYPDDQVLKRLFPDGFDHILKEQEPEETDFLRGGDHRKPVSSGHRKPVSYKDTSEEDLSDKNAQPQGGRAKNDYPDDFEKFWSIYPRKREKKRAFEIWKRKTKKVSAEVLIKAAQNYAENCKAEGTDEKYIKYPKTFLNDYEEWLEPAEPLKTNVVEFTPPAANRPNAGAYKKLVIDY